MIVPYRADVAIYRQPVANVVIIGLSVLFYILMVGYMLLHAGPFHLAGNMIFLWVFGNAICAKVGNLAYVLIYLGLGVFSAMVHLVFDGMPAVGASGAINGIVGMFLIWYPLNEITCFYWIWVRVGRFTVSSMWMILLWLAFDILGALIGAGGTAYFAHLGGFVAGAVLAAFLLSSKKVQMTRTERSLFTLFSDRR